MMVKCPNCRRKVTIARVIGAETQCECGATVKIEPSVSVEVVQQTEADS